MKKFDLEKLDKAIAYVGRMSEGRNPYSNEPYEGDALNDPNVIRCIYFIDEVLCEVRANNGVVGRGGKNNAATGFPFEVLQDFVYREDLTITYLLRDFAKLAGDADTPIINAVNVNRWLGSNGYLTKTKLAPGRNESWTPTEKGHELGIMDEHATGRGGEYIRLTYNKNAQEFLAANLQRITAESFGSNSMPEMMLS